VCKDVGGSVDCGMVTVYTAIGVLRDMLTVASEVNAWAKLGIV
jgi:hypothetical protein